MKWSSCGCYRDPLQRLAAVKELNTRFQLLQPLRDAVGGVEITADMVAGTTLGERCWVRWPYLQVPRPLQPQAHLGCCLTSAFVLQQVCIAQIPPWG